MKVLLDTSVLVATLVEHHPRHAVSLACFRDACRRKGDLHVAAHSLAETYAVLTRLPLHPPLPPGVARRLVRDNLFARAEVIELDASDYALALDRMADNAIVGGAVYDALVVQAAIKADVERLRTWNGAHFRRVWPDAGARLDVLT